MLIPEVILHYTVKTILDLIKSDFESQADEKNSVLHEFLFQDDNGMEITMNKFSYYEQGKNLFLKNEDESRKLTVNVGYNTERKGLPTIHILLPSETSGEVGIGMGEGYKQYNIFGDEGEYKRNFTNVFDSNYNMLITSDNSSEVVLIYHVLKNFMFAIFEHFENMGLRQPKISGQDLQLNTDLLPQNVYNRNISVSFFYESTVSEVMRHKLVKMFEVNPQASSY
jgi:hypothetical protein